MRSPWSQLFGVLLTTEGLFFRCPILQPAQGCQLLTGANAGFVILGLEGSLELFRQLFFPPGACCDCQHQAHGPNTPEPQQQRARSCQERINEEQNLFYGLKTAVPRSCGRPCYRTVPNFGWGHVFPERRSLISSSSWASALMLQRSRRQSSPCSPAGSRGSTRASPGQA